MTSSLPTQHANIVHVKSRISKETQNQATLLLAATQLNCIYIIFFVQFAERMQ